MLRSAYVGEEKWWIFRPHNELKPAVEPEVERNCNWMHLYNQKHRSQHLKGSTLQNVLTETRFSSTNGVSMWCLMVAMMSLKSRAVMVPLLLLSFCTKAWRACSDCSSCTNTHKQTQHHEQRPVTGKQRNPTLGDRWKYENVIVGQMCKADVTVSDTGSGNHHSPCGN